jgi:hypothetical protein
MYFPLDAVAPFSQRDETRGENEMNTKNIVAISLAAITAIALAGGSTTLLQARLKGAGRAKGHVAYELNVGKKVTAELEVEAEKLPRNTAFAVVIGNNPAIPVMTDAYGEFEIEMRLKAPNLPVINKGDAVGVFGADGQPVLAGVLQ